jgi:hypothetical protein
MFVDPTPSLPLLGKTIASSADGLVAVASFRLLPLGGR